MLVLILVACQPNANVPIARPTHLGTQGLVFYAIRDAPPSTVIEDSTVPLMFRLENRGAHNIEYGHYWLGDVDEEYFTVIDDNQMTLNKDAGSYTIEGRDLYNPVGGTEVISRRMKIKSLKGLQQQSTQKVTPLLCYPYQTVATANVCVDTDPFNILRDARTKTCTSDDVVYLPEGQGGPVGINMIETQMLPKEKGGREGYGIQFKIELANYGNGQIVRQSDYMDKCQGELDKDSIGIIKVHAKLSDMILECNVPRVDQRGSKSIICQTKEDQILWSTGGTYPAPLQLTLDYGYVEFMPSMHFTIVRRGS